MIPLLTALLTCLAEACKAYCQKETREAANEIDHIDDDIEIAIALHTPAGELRAEVLSERRKRKIAERQRPA